MKNHIPQIQEVLDANPDLKSVLITSDGCVFRVNEMTTAEVHAKTMDGKVYEAHTDNLEGAVLVRGLVEPGDDAGVATADGPKALADHTVAELKEVAEKLSLEVPKKANKAGLVALIEAHYAAVAAALGVQGDAGDGAVADAGAGDPGADDDTHGDKLTGGAVEGPTE